MTIRTVTCFVVECDACHATFDDNGDADLHFDSHDDALRYVTEHAGWNLSEHGHLLCPRCDAYIFCVERGHDWTPWTPCSCAGWIPEHFFDGCPLRRTCQRCEQVESVAFANLPTTDQPTPPGR
ncbi:MAG: hypothetical protein AB7V44_28330 [Pseudonocardia sp.]